MLVDRHVFRFTACIPWPELDPVDWGQGARQIESWLRLNIGSRHQYWAWTDSGHSYYLGVAFKWHRDRCLFLLRWL